MIENLSEEYFIKQKNDVRQPELRDLLLKEKDFAIFTYKDDLVCVIRRMEHSGVLNGYVGVNKEHPLFGIGYDDVDNINVHGGITFSGYGLLKNEDKSIWWFGFDTAHYNDVCPFYTFTTVSLGELDKYSTYKDFDFVENQVLDLARQLYNLTK